MGNIIKITSRLSGIPGEFIFGIINSNGIYLEYWDFIQNYEELKREL